MFSLSRFGDLLKYLPHGAFDRIVQRHKGDRHVKRFGCKKLLVTMICAQLSEARSLRELAICINQHRNHHHHLGLSAVSRSTLSEANQNRNPAVFEDLARLLIQLAGQTVRKQRDEMLYLLDSTCIPLIGRGLQWAGQLATRIPGLRLHVLYAANQQLPVYFTLTGENVPDVAEGRLIPLQPGAIYVFDKGYCDYGWWKRIDEAGACFVTRLKKNAAVNVERTRALDGDVHSVLSDCEISFRNKSNRGRHRNAYAGQMLRRIEVARPDGSPIVLVTNDLQAPAATIAALYKERWQIELFFKWIKQNLRIKKFLSESDNGVRIQVLTALITYLLIILAKAHANPSKTLREFADELRTGLFTRAKAELTRWHRKRQWEADRERLQPSLFR